MSRNDRKECVLAILAIASILLGLVNLCWFFKNLCEGESVVLQIFISLVLSWPVFAFRASGERRDYYEWFLNAGTRGGEGFFLLLNIASWAGFLCIALYDCLAWLVFECFVPAFTIEKSWRFVMDYTVSISANLAKAGYKKFGIGTNNDIVVKKTRDRAEIEVVLISIKRTMDREEIIRHLKRKKLRPCEPSELLGLLAQFPGAFGSRYPDVMALGNTDWVFEGHTKVGLVCTTSHDFLKMYSSEGRWTPSKGVFYAAARDV